MGGWGWGAGKTYCIYQIPQSLLIAPSTTTAFTNTGQLCDRLMAASKKLGCWKGLSVALRSFEREMNQRTRAKVSASRDAVPIVHNIDSCTDGGLPVRFMDELRNRGITAQTPQLEKRCCEVMTLLKLRENAVGNELVLSSEEDRAFAHKFEEIVANGDMPTIRRMTIDNGKACRLSNALTHCKSLYIAKFLILELKIITTQTNIPKAKHDTDTDNSSALETLFRNLENT